MKIKRKQRDTRGKSGAGWGLYGDAKFETKYTVGDLLVFDFGVVQITSVDITTVVREVYYAFRLASSESKLRQGRAGWVPEHFLAYLMRVVGGKVKKRKVSDERKAKVESESEEAEEEVKVRIVTDD